MKPDPFPDLLFPSCAECAGIGYRHVPALLWDMEDDCGADVMKAFALQHGGTVMKISAAHAIPDFRAPDLDPLTAARGWLFQAKGRGDLTIPLGPASRAARVAWTAFQMLKAGASLAQVAERTAVDLRTVCNIKNKLRLVGALPEKGSTP